MIFHGEFHSLVFTSSPVRLTSYHITLTMQYFEIVIRSYLGTEFENTEIYSFRGTIFGLDVMYDGES
jgi:hypothetical protein